MPSLRERGRKSQDDTVLRLGTGWRFLEGMLLMCLMSWVFFVGVGIRKPELHREKERQNDLLS